MRRIIFTYAIVVYFVSGHILVAQEKLPDREERIYALSAIWKEMQYNFAFPERFGIINIDSLYRAYLPRVEAAESDYEYYRILSAFMAHFNSDISD